MPHARPPGGGETGADAGLLVREPEGTLALSPQAARPSTSPAQQARAKALILRGLFIRRRLAGAAAAARPGPAQPPSSTSGLAIRA